MDVRCDRCQTEYELEDETVTEAGASVQCTSCGHTFVVSKRAVVGATPTPTPVVDAGAAVSWMLITEEGKTHRFRDPTTLQKWIVERRVARKDRVCPPGGTWRRLSEMDELRPFFEVVDQADRAAAARVVRPTAPETPARKTGGPAGYTSADADDDDVLSGRPQASAARMGAPQGGRARRPDHRLDSEATATISGVGFDTGLDDSLVLRPARGSGPKLLAGLVIIGLAGGAAYVGYTRTGGHPSEPVASAPPAAPEPSPPVPSPSAAPPPPPTAPGAASTPPASTVVASPPAPSAGSPPGGSAAPPPKPVPDRPSAAAPPPKPVPDRRSAAAPPPRPPIEEPAPADPPRAGRSSPERSPPAPPEPARPRSYEQLVAEGDRALERGNNAKAQRAFDEALRLQPDGVAAVTGSGFLMLDKQRPLAAIGMFKRALANAPAFPQALFGLGEAYRAQGDPVQAIEAYKRYLSAAPGGSDAPAARRQLRELESQSGARPPPSTAGEGSPPSN